MLAAYERRPIGAEYTSSTQQPVKRRHPTSLTVGCFRRSDPLYHREWLVKRVPLLSPAYRPAHRHHQPVSENVQVRGPDWSWFVVAGGRRL
jgi:hypothetical protein